MKTTHSWNKRLLALLLSLCITVCMLPLGAVVILADTEEDIWDRSVAAAFEAGDGSETNPYEINSCAQLAYLQNQVAGGESFEGAHFVLTRDLNFNNLTWLPIGDSRCAFKGSLDGRGHMISNLIVSDNGSDPTYLGLFGVYQGEYLKNVSMKSIAIQSDLSDYNGALAGIVLTNSLVENCHVTNILIQARDVSGGLFGAISGKGTGDSGIFDCSARLVDIRHNQTDTTRGLSGGLIGSVLMPRNPEGSYTIENCLTTGVIAAQQEYDSSNYPAGGMGGLIGKIDAGYYNTDTGEIHDYLPFQIRGCFSSVELNTPNMQYVGGLVGDGCILELTDCRAEGTVTAKNVSGGLLGGGSGATLTNCSAAGDVSGTWSVGGLVGDATANTYTGCYATGDVTARDWHTGGLVGYGPSSTFEGCFATGNVTSTLADAPNRAGGLLGNGFDCGVTNCFATGDVEGKQGDVGGLVGWVSDPTDSFTAGTFANCFAYGRVHEEESGNNSLATPLVNGMWDASSPDHATTENCYYSSQVSGKADSNGIDQTPGQFSDGTVLALLGGAFVQIGGAAAPTLPVVWNGKLNTLQSGLYYRVPEGETVRLGDTNVLLFRMEAGAALDLQGALQIGTRVSMTVGGQILCGENGGLVLEPGTTNTALTLNAGGSIQSIQVFDGSVSFEKGSSVGKAEVDLPVNPSTGLEEQMHNAGSIRELTLKGGDFYNSNNAVIEKAVIAGGTLNNNYLRFNGLDLIPPVIQEAVVQGGRLYQWNESDSAHAGTPFESFARLKKLTMDMTAPSGIVYNSFGGVIEEAVLDGGNAQIDGSQDTAVFDNYKGGVVDKLTVKGNAGYNIYNRNDTEYGAPLIRELTTDGGYCTITNDTGGVIQNAAIWYNSELVNNRRAVIENAFIHESNVRNTFHQGSNTGGVIEKLYTTDWSVINNWAPAEINELYADDSGNGNLYISGVNGENPDAASGVIGKLYYRIVTDPDAPGAFSAWDNTTQVDSAGDGFNGLYGLPGAQVGFAFQYAGTGKLTGLELNGSELSEDSDGSYSFLMPNQNAVLSAADRALSNDATLNSLSYSVDGGTPVPVPDFEPEGESYSITLPRTTPRDASITLSGRCADANASITANEGAALRYGVTGQPVPITVTAEDGTIKTYQLSFSTQAEKADLLDAAISGVGEGERFIQNETPAFTAIGSNLGNENPAVYDERYCPADWSVDDGSVLSGSWTDAPFTGSLELSQLAKGPHTLTVRYRLEQFGELYQDDKPTDEYGWIAVTPDNSEALTKSVAFTVDPVTYALTVVNGTDETGGNPYEEGSVVALRADAPPSGYVFDKWAVTSGVGTLGDAGLPETAFTMGAGDATVAASYKDIEAPTGEIRIAGNGWKELLNTISFGLFFKESQDVTVTAEDTSGSEVTIDYFLSEQALTLEDLEAKTEGWTATDGRFSVDPDVKCIVYARLTDASGNTSYLSSDGVVLDATPPSIEGAQDGKTYETTLAITVTDAYLKTVTVNGEAKAVENGSSAFALTENGVYTIAAADEAGNETIATVTVDLPYTLSFDAGGGTPIPEEQTLKQGERPAPVENPKRAGYTFLGWYVGERKIDLNTFEMPAADVALTAGWKKQENASGAPGTGDDAPFVIRMTAMLLVGAAILLWSRRRAKKQAK